MVRLAEEPNLRNHSDKNQIVQIITALEAEAQLPEFPTTIQYMGQVEPVIRQTTRQYLTAWGLAPNMPLVKNSPPQSLCKYRWLTGLSAWIVSKPITTSKWNTRLKSRLQTNWISGDDPARNYYVFIQPRETQKKIENDGQVLETLVRLEKQHLKQSRLFTSFTGTSCQLPSNWSSLRPRLF